MGPFAQFVDMNMYRLVEMTFFIVFLVCLRDAWHRGKMGDGPKKSKKVTDSSKPRRREEDDESKWYIQPEDEWERLPAPGGDRKKRQPGYLWVCIMIAAMAFTYFFEYKLTHRAKEGEPPGSDAIYSYVVPPMMKMGGIKEDVANVTIAGGWDGDGVCKGDDIPLGDNTCEKAGSAVPLWIPCGWALIIYLVMRTSDKLAIAWYKRPVLDGLMALVIDFSLDPVASWNHWWLWDFSKQPDLHPTIFFKVPATNYMAWVVIVGSFSLCIRLFQRWRVGDLSSGIHHIPSKIFGKFPRGFIGDLLVPVLAIVPAVVLVILYTNHARFLMRSGDWFTNGALLCSVVWAVLMAWLYLDAPVMRRDHAHDHVLMFSPLAIYGVVIVALYSTRVPKESFLLVHGRQIPFEQGMLIYEAMPELVIMVPLAALLGGIVFAWPYSKPGPESWW